MTAADVAVVGGGPVGLAVAWRLARDGAGVAVVDAHDEGAAWRASAGMLAVPVASRRAGDPMLALHLEGLQRWPAFAEALEDATGASIGFARSGGLVVALDLVQAHALGRAYASEAERGRRVEWLGSAEARAAEPALTPIVQAAVSSPPDAQVDPRLLVPALRRAVEAAGGRVIEARASGILAGPRGPGVATDAGDVAAAAVVVAAGAWSSALDGSPEEIRRARLRPLKGQILRLRGEGAPARILHSPELYLFTRPGGEIVAGATVEDAGYDTAPTAAGVAFLLGACMDLVPDASGWSLEEVRAGLRPASADGEPLIGRTGADGVLVAAGHLAQGVLLAPLTADAIADLIAGREPPEAVRPFAPERFSLRAT